jgi:aspartyl-tRNA synthetase
MTCDYTWETHLLDFLGNLKRTNYAGELRGAHAGQDVVLLGWVHGRRDLGNLIFIDLRDRAGLAQVVFNKETSAAAHAKAEQLRSEYVIAVEGRVVARQKPNPDLPTGEIEIVASALHILNTAKTPPFLPEDEINVSEETRLRYRYLDLRRAKPHRNIALRHQVLLEMRKALDEMGFYEVETPMLTRSTPEGARDYLVPSRIYPGQFYALPQSPQIFKQILMISGMDRYFQIVRCFRDEDLRADRQPEFTQLDLEMSFARPDDVFEVIERVMERAMRVIGVEVPVPFPRMLYKDVVRRYGSDKPDLRFGMELHDVTPQLEPAREALKFEGRVFAVVAPKIVRVFSRKHAEELSEHAKLFGARAIYTVSVFGGGEGTRSSLTKVLGEGGVQNLVDTVGAQMDDVVVVAAAKQIPGTEAAALVAGQVRLYLAEKFDLIPPKEKGAFRFTWITGFPLFEWSERDNFWSAAQHPFTGIVEEDLHMLDNPVEYGEIRSKGYDLVLNGYELGSGSVRIHRQDIQARVFRALGLSEEQARQRFGFFLDALSYGTPPHGGIALGLDRVVMLMAGEKSIREVIAFPKTAKAQDLMAESPSVASLSQLLRDLQITPQAVLRHTCEKCDSEVFWQQAEIPSTPGQLQSTEIDITCLFCGTVAQSARWFLPVEVVCFNKQNREWKERVFS